MIKIKVSKPNSEKSERGEEKKWSKQAAMYLFRPDVLYQCSMCWAYKDGKCAVFGPSQKVEEMGSCNFFGHFHPDEIKVVVPFMGFASKDEAGYEVNKAGYTCGRCEYFNGKGDCSKVDKNSEGDTPGTIAAKACCNRWEADKKRGSMSDVELDKFFNK